MIFSTYVFRNASGMLFPVSEAIGSLDLYLLHGNGSVSCPISAIIFFDTGERRQAGTLIALIVMDSHMHSPHVQKGSTETWVSCR